MRDFQIGFNNNVESIRVPKTLPDSLKLLGIEMPRHQSILSKDHLIVCLCNPVNHLLQLLSVPGRTIISSVEITKYHFYGMIPKNWVSD